VRTFAGTASAANAGSANAATKELSAALKITDRGRN
jgi:hypothetical protein